MCNDDDNAGLVGGLEHEFHDFPFSWEETSQLTRFLHHY